uniref:hypothetical protein n=1 Tax=Pseudonocardia sp. CA-138482 TaxID=3240023 RepID=UPI003F493CF2
MNAESLSLPHALEQLADTFRRAEGRLPPLEDFVATARAGGPLIIAETADAPAPVVDWQGPTQSTQMLPVVTT